MLKRYLVTTFRTPNFQPKIIDAHYAFLDQLRRQKRLDLAGPFADQTGGAYILRAENLDEAQVLAYGDPLHTSGSSLVSVYEWNAS